MSKLYVIGSLRNPEVQEVANSLRNQLGLEVFDDWLASGPQGDDEWRDYEKRRGRTYLEALSGYAAQHVFEYDKHHLDTSDGALLVMPCGKSAFLELGYMVGRGKWTGILLNPDEERWDVMFQFATRVSDDLNVLMADYFAHQAQRKFDTEITEATAKEFTPFFEKEYF